MRTLRARPDPPARGARRRRSSPRDARVRRSGDDVEAKRRRRSEASTTERSVDDGAKRRSECATAAERESSGARKVLGAVELGTQPRRRYVATAWEDELAQRWTPEKLPEYAVALNQVDGRLLALVGVRSSGSAMVGSNPQSL